MPKTSEDLVITIAPATAELTTQQATVVTCNRRDFKQVPGLTIVDWTIDRT